MVIIKNKGGAGEMAHQLRTHKALTEDQNSVLSTHTKHSQMPETAVPEISTFYSGL